MQLWYSGIQRFPLTAECLHMEEPRYMCSSQFIVLLQEWFGQKNLTLSIAGTSLQMTSACSAWSPTSSLASRRAVAISSMSVGSLLPPGKHTSPGDLVNWELKECIVNQHWNQIKFSISLMELSYLSSATGANHLCKMLLPGERGPGEITWQGVCRRNWLKLAVSPGSCPLLFFKLALLRSF